MAASGFTPISLYYSTTASAVPTSGNLANGELGLNINDMKLYAKNSAGTVTLLASNAGASGSVTSVAASVPAFLSIAGSPITTSGTLAITLSGTALPIANGGTGTTSTTFANLTTNVTGLLPIANGGTATSTPALVAGTGVTISGTWPNQTINATGTGGTVTSVAGAGTVNGLTLTGTVTSSGSLTLGGTLSGVANAALTNSSVTVTAGTGMSGGGAVALGSSITLTNAGVTSIVAGTGISVSGATGAVTVTSTVAGGSQAFVAFGTTGESVFASQGF